MTETQISAQIILDSEAPNGSRLTTMELTYPRFIHAEVMTHRVYCLAGDSKLEFDLPNALENEERRVFYQNIESFVEKWNNGVNRKSAKLKKKHDLSWMEDDVEYAAPDVAEIISYSKTSIHKACREGKIKGAYRKILEGSRVDFKQGPWVFSGQSFKAWRSEVERSDFGHRQKLSQMQIRQTDESTGLITHSTVEDAFYSGEKPVFEIKANGKIIAASKDHLFMTELGVYKRLENLAVGDSILMQTVGLPESEKRDPLRLKKINGQWRSSWQAKVRKKMIEEGRNCQECHSDANLQIHHVVPVHKDPSLAFKESNVKLLCQDCHNLEHDHQSWQVEKYMFAKPQKIESIEFRGIEKTYDLTIAGDYPNFIANGFVVHNSRNSASSRAIPVSKQIERVRTDPAIPVEFGSHQSGMQAGPPVENQAEALEAWLKARDEALVQAQAMLDLGVHKQVVNRILEPWSWITVIFSGTSWENFWLQRDSDLAQPEIHELAQKMKTVYSESQPQELNYGYWHTPYIRASEYETLNPEIRKQISAARCARVSYLTHDGQRDLEKDLELYQRLITASPGHWSPLEHVGTPELWPRLRRATGRHQGNFRDFRQLRHDLEFS